MNDVTKNNFHFVLITEEEYFDYSTYEYYQLSLQKKRPRPKGCLAAFQHVDFVGSAIFFRILHFTAQRLRSIVQKM